ncbi:maleate isomerase [Labrenzia sp. EL_208]|uniref:maleate cis-trans isomerase family protein n=1 Tax=Roseibium album TaxID=311410 RepID=UPI0018C91FD4|nr:maleate isomerase [Labrenzia sp. EL_132]MBG6231034.1 maleate isomerase [Labrenzia sp. EL_208]MCR9056481.1 aspartate/glutamate racemase family protein [Paracoccaceae bacterium]
MKLEFDTDIGIGTRATMGMIVLETDETLEPEFSRIMALEGVALYHSRIPMVPEVRADTLAKMERDLPASARLLPSAPDYDVIGYGCTSASSVIGSENVASAIRTVYPNALVSDPLAAVIAAGRELKAKRLGFITPYIPEVSERMRRRLVEAGFDIAGFGSFEEGNDRTVARICEKSIVAAAENIAAAAPCDAIVISCTSLRTLNIIKEMERKVGVPIISSNQALAWHMLRLAKIRDPLPDFGLLFG